MIKLLIYLFTAFLILMTIGCSYDNEIDYYGSMNCDLDNVTFNETIDPILERNCRSCHFSGNGTGIELSTYEDVGDLAENGKLLGSIKHQPGYDPMPQGGKLDDCTIEKIETWITNGYPNN